MRSRKPLWTAILSLVLMALLTGVVTPLYSTVSDFHGKEVTTVELGVDAAQIAKCPAVESYGFLFSSSGGIAIPRKEQEARKVINFGGCTRTAAMTSRAQPEVNLIVCHLALSRLSVRAHPVARL